MFHRDFAERFIRADLHPELKCKLCMHVAEGCKMWGVHLLYHSPSLVQHQGEISTVSKAGLNENRVAGWYCDDTRKLTDGTLEPCPPLYHLTLNSA